MNYIKILLLLLLVTLASCSDKDDNYYFNPIIAPENENQLLDVSYGTDSEQKMDIILPKNRVTDVTKVFILVHGGGWSSGDKSDFNSEVTMLYNAFPDCAIVNVNYRLGTEESIGFPKQINDLQKVVAFLNSKYKDYHISKKYAMVGVSAGAHLSLLYSYKYNSNNQIKAVCNIVGPVDFSDPNYEGNSLFPAGLVYFVGNYPTYQDNPSLYNFVSPVNHVTTKSPKTIMFYGNSDPLVPNTQGAILHDKLDSKNVVNEYYLYDAGHANWNADQYADINEKTINFFRRYFK